MVSTPERFTNHSKISPKPSVTVRNPSEIKSLHLFTEVWDVKKKTTLRQVGDNKSKCKAIRAGSMLG